MKVKLEGCTLGVHKSPSIVLYFCFSTHYLIIKINLMMILLTNVVHCLKTMGKVINSNDTEGRGDATGAHLMIKTGVRNFSSILDLEYFKFCT